jgi:hypothetical protein
MVARVSFNLRAAALGACLMMTAACEQPPPAGDQPAPVQHQQLSELSQGDGPMPFDRRRASGLPDDVVVVGIAFTVERYVVPTDDLAAARRTDVWSLVDELRVPPDDIAHLKTNGMRVGVAGPAQAEVLREIMPALGARGEVMNRVVQSGAPMTLDFGSTGSYQTVYVFHRDGRLEGSTFDDATKFLHVDYRVDLDDDAPLITLALTPELFKESEQPHWRVAEGQYRYEKEYQGTAYRDLSVEVRVRDGETLVVGPSAQRRNAYLVGSTILGHETAGRDWGTIVLITPQLHLTDGGENGDRE